MKGIKCTCGRTKPDANYFLQRSLYWMQLLCGSLAGKLADVETGWQVRAAGRQEKGKGV